MEKKNNRNSHIMMNKGMKQKVSVLLIACLLLTGYHGLTISGKAEQTSKSESNEISVSGTEVRVQLLGEDLRRAAREAIEKGTKVEGAFPEGYSGDGELQKEYEAIFSPEKEVYEIPLDSISEGLSESLSEEEAGLQIFVERDAKDLESLVRKESKESLLLYDGNSQLAQLFPERKKEEKQDKTEKAKELTEGAAASSSSIEETAVASDSNIERRNTELTGSELITFLYKNKSEHKISFKLSVDGNQYPKLVVAPKAQLFKGLVEKLKKEEKKAPAEVKPAEKQEEKPAETKEEQAKEEPVKAESSEEKKQLAEENAPVEEKEEKSVSEVSIVSTEGKAKEAQPEAKEVEEKTEKSEEQKEDKVETAEAESKEESAEKGVEVEKDGAQPAEAEKEAANTEKQADEKGRFDGFLQEVLDHYEEFLAELSSARFRRYSLNELGRKTQNVEIKDFATVEVFYDEDAFADEEGNTQEVVLKANRLLKKEEAEKEGEKLTDEQIEAMKEHSIYEGSDALDIRFVSKEDETKEIEPKNPVSVRLTFDKKAVPEEANADTIAIHHIVEDKDSGKVKYVETVLRSELEKEREKEELKASEGVKEDVLFAEGASEEPKKEGIKKEEVFSNEDEKTEHKENITKEFMVNSFSAYIVHWTTPDNRDYEIRFHYVDKNFREIAPTIYTQNYAGRKRNVLYFDANQRNSGSPAYKEFPNFVLEDIGYQQGPAPYLAYPQINDWGVDAVYSDKIQITRRSTLSKPEGQRETKVLTFDKNGCAHDVYFIYRLNCLTTTINERTRVDLLNEKFITDNLDGTYELTLTGQVDPSQKQKLDIAFVYDNTAIMATDFDFSGKNKKLGIEHYAANPNNAKSAKVKSELKAFMEKLSANPDYDVRYALVTMDGDKSFGNINEGAKKKYDQSYINGKDYQNMIFMKGQGGDSDINLVGEYRGTTNNVYQWLDKSTDYDATSYQFNVIDTPFNDTKHLYGFTDKPNKIVDQLKALDERAITSKTVSGENYESAIRNLKVLLGQGGNYQVASGGLVNQNSTARSDAQKIVVFIAGGNPKLSYIVKDGIYEDTHRYADNEDYRIRRDYKEGYSFGNGYSVDFSALNRARGELQGLTAADAFYSIGVGNKDNWKLLNDFAMGQSYNTDGNRIKITENGNTDFIDVFHPDRRERALAYNVRYKCFDASGESGLVSALQKIYEREAGTRVNNIVIRDVLTNNVQPIMKDDGKPDVFGQLVKMKPNGNKQAVEVEKVLELAEMEKLGLNGFTIEAKKVSASETGISGLSYDGERWLLTLKTIPEDFALPTGYDIRMVARIEATTDAKKSNNFANQGEARTDLNAIYKEYLGRDYHDKDGKPDNMFNSSTGKFGLFTNEVADISYKTRKPDGSQETPPPKKYNKPIIRMGNLVFEKTFVGIEEKDFFKASSGFTELGKKVLKQINFKVFREKKGVEELLLTINLGDEEIIKNLGKGPFEYKGYLLEFTRGTGTQVSITMKGMPLNRVYRVQEEVLDSEKELRESETAKSGYKFDEKLHQETQEEQHLIEVSMNYHFKNKYVHVQTPKKTVTIKKIVKGKSTANEQFDFYMVLYNGDSPYGLLDTTTIASAQVKATTDKIESVGKIKVKEPIDTGTEKNLQAIHFTLGHNESVAFTMDTNVNFKLFELKKDGYDKAEVIGSLNGKDTDLTEKKEAEVDGKSSSYTAILSNMGQTITFTNPKKITPPTGLHRELAPYLISIFGFVAMAGLYFGINEKRRREI